jgi:iron complex transport system ATP-binding protein
MGALIDTTMSEGVVLDINDLVVVRGGREILGPLTWKVREHERWVVLGSNGAGKTTLFNVAAAMIHPTRGSVHILNERLGAVDVFDLRPRIGLMASSIASEIPSEEKVIDVVLTAAYAIMGRWTEPYDLWDESRAKALLTTLGVRELGERLYGTLSDGERKRVLIARALMADPELLLLDEPASGLDLAGREDLLSKLRALAMDIHAPSIITITHHIEEIPTGTTHALLLSKGKVVAQGLISEVVTNWHLTEAYGLPITVTQEEGRFFARASFSD